MFYSVRLYSRAGNHAISSSLFFLAHVADTVSDSSLVNMRLI
jgi:hypothetical protein